MFIIMKSRKIPNLSVGQFSRNVSYENGLVRVEKEFKHLTEEDMEVVRKAYHGLYPTQPQIDEDYATD